LDDEGACIQQLEDMPNPPRMVYVTPAHNNPLGTQMSLSRRVALLTWIEQHGSLVIENDQSCHYRYNARPMPALHSLDPTRSRVIYLSSFESILEPLVRLAFVVIPKSLVRLFAAERHLRQNIPALDQLVLADFLRSASLERHIHRNNQVLA